MTVDLAYYWALEERADDALVAYLGQSAPGVTVIVPAGTADAYTEPSVTVHFSQSDNHNPTGRVSGHRDLFGTITIRTPATSQKDGQTILRDVRDRHAEVKHVVMSALVVRADNGGDDNRALSDAVNALETPGIEFSKIRVGALQRAYDSERNALVTEITVNAIAHPTRGA